MIDGDGLHGLVSTMSRGKADCAKQKLVLCDPILPFKSGVMRCSYQVPNTCSIDPSQKNLVASSTCVVTSDNCDLRAQVA